MDLPADAITRQPSIPFSVLAADLRAFACLTDAVEWALGEVRAALSPA